MKDTAGNKANQATDATQPEERRAVIQRLFEDHNDSLLRFLSVRLNSVEEAREVAQEAYVRLLKLDEPNAVSFFRAFLFRTAANLAIDRIRQRDRAGRYLPLVFPDVDEPSAEDCQASREKIQLITGYLRELPPKCRQAFLLGRIDGLSTRQIAARMRLSERSVRSYVLRAVVHIRSRLQRDLGESHGQ